MGEIPEGQVTKLLGAVCGGDPRARDELMEVVYGDLRALARRSMGGVPPTDTLQPTALVNECYLRLLGKLEMQWRDRRHFFALAARAMHDIVIERARRHLALKRGGGRRPIPFKEDEHEIAIDAQAADLVGLSEALPALERDDPLGAEILMLRFFSGLTNAQVAEALGVSPDHARREWAYAKAFLRREIEGEAAPAN